MALVTAGAAASAFLWPIVEAHSPLTLFYPAIIVCAWKLGPGPTMLAMIGGIGWIESSILPTESLLIETDPRGHIQLATFLLVGSGLMLMSMRIDRARMHIQQSERSREATQETLRLVEAMHRARGHELQALMDILDTPVFIAHDPQFNYVTGNEAAYALMGMEPGTNFTLNAPHPCYEVWIDGAPASLDDLPMRRAVATGKPACAREMELRCRDGQVRWMYGTAVPLLNEDGEVRGCMGAFVDITDRVMAQNAMRLSEERLAATLRYARVAVMQQNRDLRYTWAHNTSIISHADFLGRTDEELFGPETGRLLTALKRKVLAEGDAARHRLTLSNKGGTRHFDLSIEPLRDEEGAITGLTVAAIDVTEQCTVTEQLAALHQTLEQRVAERTAATQRQVDHLRRLASQLAQAEQRERRRLAHTLHDHLQQILVAAKLGVNALRNRSEDQVARDAACRVDEWLHQALQVSRSLSAQLCPPILHEAGLAPALRWLAQMMLDSHALHVSLAIEPDAEPDNEDVRTMLFEAVRELLRNMADHGVRQASLVVSRSRAGRIVVVVAHEDQPTQEQADRKAETEALASIHLRHRLDLMGIQFQVRSDPGQGVRASLSVRPAESPANVRPTPQRYANGATSTPQNVG